METLETMETTRTTEIMGTLETTETAKIMETMGTAETMVELLLPTTRTPVVTIPQTMCCHTLFMVMLMTNHLIPKW